MIDHLSVQVDDLDASARFYDTVLAPLGGRRILEFDNRIGYGLDFPSFWIHQAVVPGSFRETHIAFAAADREQVLAFQAAAESLSVEVLHEPRAWPEYHSGYFGAFVRDPDGNNVEAVHHGGRGAS